MKNKNILVASMAMLAGVLQAKPSNNLSLKNNIITVSAKQIKEKKVTKQEKEIKFNGFGGINQTFWDGGRPPKQYGQWLQERKKQKWNK
jgi:hypothetical protein